MALAAVLCMSSACLAATRTGYFTYVQEAQEPKHWEDGVRVSYDVSRRFMLFWFASTAGCQVSSRFLFYLRVCVWSSYIAEYGSTD